MSFSSKYKIELAPLVDRQLKKLSDIKKAPLIQKLESLEESPLPKGVKKLAGMKNLYRIRSGNFRIIYQVNNKILTILVVKIGDRKDVYNNLKSLIKTFISK